jgi:serine/threonine protein kinase
VNHFDLKLDNILISPLNEAEAEDANWWHQSSSVPNFTVCLAGSISCSMDIELYSILIFFLEIDFGESIVYVRDEDGYTMRSCGTEFNKSPEMLNAGL